MIFINDMYRPLPKEVTIKKSYIEGLGLFANDNLSANTELGISHIKDNRFENDYIRTPLGGFVNHSTTPNCEFYIISIKKYIPIHFTIFSS